MRDPTLPKYLFYFEDYALIKDFKLNQNDVIRLHGSANWISFR